MPFDVINDAGDTVEILGETVRAIVIYNVFDFSTRQIVDLDWEKNKTLDEYLGDLPEDVDWEICVDNHVYERNEWRSVILRKDDCIVATVKPNFSLAALTASITAALSAPAFVIGTWTITWGMVALTTLAIGGALVLSMLAKPNQSTSKKDPESYGYDGPQNTSGESYAVPVIYGTFMTAGNCIAIYTENSTDITSQRLYAAYAVSEGPIQSITDLYLNNQPLDNFSNVTWDQRLGLPSQSPMNWFTANNEANNVQTELLYPTPYNYTTLTQVTRVRMDFEFPSGLYQVNSSNGNQNAYSCTINAGYRLTGSGDAYTSLAQGPEWFEITASEGNTVVACSGVRLTVQVTGDAGVATTAFSILAQIKRGTDATTDGGEDVSNSYQLYGGTGGGQVLSSTAWTNMGSNSGTINNTPVVQDGGIIYYPQTLTFVYEIDNLQFFNYNFQVSGATIIKTEAYFYQALTFKNNYRSAWRFSLFTPPLPLGQYDFQFVRTDAVSTSEYKVDDIYLVNINEITDGLVAYNNTAYYAIQCELNSTMTGNPSTTVIVQGKIVAIYDRNGNITTNAWSNNPADIALDMLLNANYRFGISSSRMDFGSFDDWRQYCNTNSLFFNGVFSDLSNVWDCLTDVLRVGHANIIQRGMLWTIVLEAPADPVMMFTQSNMIKNTFKQTWTGRKNRANVVEIQYWDENNLYKQTSAFAIDSTYLNNGDALVQSTIQMIGVNNATQAQNEANFQLNLNRYITQSCQFDVFIQALGCTIGDVIYVQHDMPQWGYEARITAVNLISGLGTITIDSPVPSDGESDWKMLMLQSVALTSNAYVQAISGTQITVYNFTSPAWVTSDSSLGLPDPTATFTPETWNVGINNNGGYFRLAIDGQDYDVVDQVIVGSTIVFTTDRTVSAAINDTVQIFKIDLLCEASLAALPAPTSTTSQTLTINGWTADAGNPLVGDRIMLGQVGQYKKPFRVTKITYNTDNVRTIGCIEYNASVYTPYAGPVPDLSALSLFPLQVINLYCKQDSMVMQGGSVKYQVEVDWSIPLNDPMGYVGANIYYNTNGGAWLFLAYVAAPTSVYTIDCNIGDVVTFKVVSQVSTGASADFNSAPITSLQVSTTTNVPTDIDPDGLTATAGFQSITVAWDQPNDDFVGSYQVWENASDSLTGAANIWSGSTTNFTQTSLATGAICYYWVRSVSTAQTYGNFVGPVSAQTIPVESSDLATEIAATSSYAQSLLNALTSPTDVATLPAASSVPAGTILFQESDSKLYQSSGTAWTPLVMPLQNGTGTITSTQVGANSITTPAIAANAITGSQIQADTITTAHLVADSITTGLIQAGAVTSDQVASNQIYGYHMASSTIISSSGQMGSLTVGTPTIEDDSVTSFFTASTTSPVTSSGITSFATLINFSFSVPESRQGVVFVNAQHDYHGVSGGSFVAHEFQIYIDGTLVQDTTGDAINDYPSICFAYTFATGSHTIEVKWAAAYGSSYIIMDECVCTVLARAV